MTDATAIVGAQAISEFRVGQVFAKSLRILRKGFWRYLLLASISILSSLLVLLGVVGGTAGVLISILLQVLIGFAVQGAIIYGAFQEMRGRKFTLTEAISRCLGRIGPILGATLLFALIGFFASLLLVVSGVIAFIMLSVTIPACVVEGTGPVASLKRSAELTKGFRGKIFGLYVLVVLALIGLGVVVQVPLALMAPKTIATLGNLVVTVINTAFGAVVASTLYFSLRAAKEGISIERIASVFE